MKRFSLGKLLQKRFSRKKPAPRRRSPARKARGSVLSRISPRALPSPAREDARPPASVQVTEVAKSRPAEVQVLKKREVPERAAEREYLPPAPEPTVLSTRDFVRPDDRLKQAIEAFLLDQRSPHTRTAYAKDLKRFVQFLMRRGLERGVERLERSVLVAYKESLMGEGLQHTTIDRHLATLRSFFGWLVADGIMEKNPAEAVRFLNPKRISRTVGFTDPEVQKILAQPNLHTRIGAQHYAILMILFYCGLRRSEVCELRTSSLFIERNIPILRLRGKGNKERIIPVTAPVYKAIRYYLRITGRDPNKDAPLFVGFRRRILGAEEAVPLNASTIFYIVTKYAKQAGISSRVSPHSCRATAISNARDHQVPDRSIQEFAGWASTDMITRYDKRKSAIEKSAAHAIHYGPVDRLPEEAKSS
jgi:site-specific recombinase XerD